MNKRKFTIAIIILLLDQITKLIVQTYDIHQSVIGSFFKLDYAENDGIAWSMLSGHNILIIISSLVLILVIYKLMYSFKTNKLTNFSFGLLFGGVLGNLVDRVFYSYVRDFLSFKIFSYNYPIFNIADMAIVIGVFLLVIETFREKDSNEVSSWFR